MYPPSPIRAFMESSKMTPSAATSRPLCSVGAAISHQVRRLEDFLDVALFRRHGHGVALTPVGVDYCGDVSAILDGLDASTERIRGTEAAGPLSVRATPAFASRWLVPRLGGFNAPVD